jgi:hypothetical protein
MARKNHWKAAESELPMGSKGWRTFIALFTSIQAATPITALATPVNRRSPIQTTKIKKPTQNPSTLALASTRGSPQAITTPQARYVATMLDNT